MTVKVPIRVVSETNKHEHWRYRQKRAKLQHAAVAFALGPQPLPKYTPFARNLATMLPAVITLTRIAPRPLDKSNNVGALKHVQDAVAKWFGLDDRSPRLMWDYDQAKGRANEYAVRIQILPVGSRLDPEEFGLRDDPNSGGLIDGAGNAVPVEAPAGRVNLFLRSCSRALTGERILHLEINDEKVRLIDHADGTVSWDGGSATEREVVKSFRELEADRRRRAVATAEVQP